MSEQQGPTLLGEAFLEVIRQAVRAEIQSLGAQVQAEDRLLDAEAAAEMLSVSPAWLYHTYLGIQKYLAAKIVLQKG